MADNKNETNGQRIRRLYDQFFDPMPDWVTKHQVDKIEKAESILRVIEEPYFQEFMEWATNEANKPIQLSDSHNIMIAASARANTLKEVAQKIRKDLNKAIDILDRLGDK